jgi:hypothetical protein
MVANAAAFQTTVHRPITHLQAAFIRRVVDRPPVGAAVFTVAAVVDHSVEAAVVVTAVVAVVVQPAAGAEEDRPAVAEHRPAVGVESINTLIFDTKMGV